MSNYIFSRRFGKYTFSTMKNASINEKNVQVNLKRGENQMVEIV
jgi:hypothetical protein